MATEEKLDYEKLRIDQATEISRLSRELAKANKAIRGYKGLEAQRNRNIEHEHPQETTKEPETTSKNPHEDEKPHFVGHWHKFCPSCGDPNPNFKDETICDPNQGGCGMHLGAKEEAAKLKACPNCGGKKAKLIVGTTNTGTTTT